jgi:hypothetical protein
MQLWTILPTSGAWTEFKGNSGPLTSLSMHITRLQATPPMSPRGSYGYGRHSGLLGHLEVTLKPSLGVRFPLVMCVQVQEGLKGGTS